MQKVRSKSAQFTFLTFALYPEKEPDQLNRTEPSPTEPNRTEPCWTGLGVPQLPELCCCQRGFCAAVTTHSHKETQRHAGTHKHTHLQTHSTKTHTETERTITGTSAHNAAPNWFFMPVRCLHLTPSPSVSLSCFLCLALCDVTSVELTYTWGFCETMFLNQIKIRNEHFTRHCICFAVNFTFPECSPSSPCSTTHLSLASLEHFQRLFTHTHTHRSYAAVHLLLPVSLPLLSFKFY